MRPESLLRWSIITIIMFLEIIHYPSISPEIGTNSIDWAQLSRFYLKTETESSLRNVVLKYKQDGVLDKKKQDDG
jgi:hypothetical protein